MRLRRGNSRRSLQRDGDGSSDWSNQILRELDQRLWEDADDQYAGHRNIQRSFQRRRQRERLVVGDAIAEMHHLDEAEVIVERDDGVDDGPDREPDEPVLAGWASATLNQPAEQNENEREKPKRDEARENR